MEDKNNSIVKKTLKSEFLNSRYFKIVKQYKVFDGRTGREEYWFFILLNILISITLSLIWSGLGIIFLLVILVPSVAISVRRLHDINMEGWFLFIPIYSLILLSQKGTEINVANDYGSAPEEKKIKIYIFFVLMALSLIIIIGKSVYTQYQIKKAQQEKDALYASKTSEIDQQKLKEQNEASLIEVEKAQTIDEILKAYQNAPKGSSSSLAASTKWISLCNSSIEIKDANNYFPEFSEARTKALEKWIELTKKELELAQTIQEAKFVYENAPEDEELKTTIYNKWNELSLKNVEEIKTVKDAKEAYNNSPIGSQAKTKILEKWKQLSLVEIEQVNSFQNMRDLYSNFPDDEEIKNKGLTKWISLCQTAQETKEVYANTLTKTDLKRLTLEKWKELAKQEIDKLQNIQDLKNLYENLPPDDTKLKSSLLTKWISLCQTSKETKEVYSYTSTNSDERKTAFTKWDNLSLKEIEEADTLAEVTEVYNNTPDNSQSRKTASEKMKELQ